MMKMIATYNQVMEQAGNPVGKSWTRGSVTELKMIVQSVSNSSDLVKELGPSFICEQLENGDYKLTVCNRFEVSPLPDDAIGLEEMPQLMKDNKQILITYKSPDIWIHRKYDSGKPKIVNMEDDSDAQYLPVV